MVLSKGH
ncbi:hypothetical protein VTH06DRAFT_2778 [Thermothelomyces fergusii]